MGKQMWDIVRDCMLGATTMFCPRDAFKELFLKESYSWCGMELGETAHGTAIRARRTNFTVHFTAMNRTLIDCILYAVIDIYSLNVKKNVADVLSHLQSSRHRASFVSVEHSKSSTTVEIGSGGRADNLFKTVAPKARVGPIMISSRRTVLHEA